MLHESALEGLKVVDLSRLLPGPYCSMVLADHGADVIAVEDSRFRADGLFFNEINRNKRHMTLNLKQEEGREIFYKLVAEADVVIEGFRPGVVKRLGVDYEAVRSVNPRIIYCSITGYGQTGPRHNEVGHDVNYLSRAGVLHMVGEESREPSIPAVQVADIAGGAMQAVIGILLALHARERTGEGQYVDISMTDGILGLLTLPGFFKRSQGERPKRSAMTLSHKFACYNTYRTKDDRFLAVGALENRFWKQLCECLGVPEYISLQYNLNRRREVIHRFRILFAGKTLAEWEEIFAGRDVCCSGVATYEEVVEEPMFAEREMIFEYSLADGSSAKGFGIPVKLSATPGMIRRGPAGFGEHTREILATLGYDEAGIEKLVADGVL